MILLEKDFKEGFYGSVIRSENVVIITNVDVDSLCAATILTNLLETDEVMYSLLAISSWSELKELFDEYSLLNNPPTHYVLLNCGGYRSFLEMEIELPKKSSIFIIDSKRPFHLDNVFSAEGIHVLCLDSELNELNLPEYSQIVDPNSQSDSDSDEEDAENQEISIAERVERRLLKRKEMAVHRQNRDQILFEYNRFTYTSIPTSVFLLKLAHSMGKSTAGLTWCAAVGLSSYQVENSISTQTYSAICLEHMKPFIRRFGPREKLRIDPNFRISFDRELQLPLYRHWTLNDSIFNNLFFHMQSTNVESRRKGPCQARLRISRNSIARVYGEFRKFVAGETKRNLRDFGQVHEQRVLLVLLTFGLLACLLGSRCGSCLSTDPTATT
ncbi:hypothetical protein M3Y94_00688100 [Aphelenchoides besseyi]|nr:hypothetical protein M3Y94_00688100 [Aphelenchoides besseyi]